MTKTHNFEPKVIRTTEDFDAFWPMLATNVTKILENLVEFIDHGPKVG